MIRTAEQIEAEIKAKRAEQCRLPVHFTDKRDAIAAELEVLVLEWIAL